MKKLLFYLSGLFLFASLVGNVFALGSSAGSIGSIGSDAQLWRTTAAGTYLIPTMTGAGVVRDIGATGDRIPKGWFADLDSTIATIGGLTTGAIIIDVTDVEAFLVRRDADAGDVFAVDTTNSRVFLPDTIPLAFGNTSAAPDTTIAWNTAQTVDGWYFGTATGQNTLILAENGDIAFDFAHGAAANPTLFIHSAAQSTTQWLGLVHTGTNALIGSGVGNVDISPASNIIRLLDVGETGGIGFTVTAAGNQAMYTTGTTTNSFIIQQQTFTPGGSYSAVQILPTFATENFNHVVLNLAGTQNAGNSAALVGINLSMVKATGATTLDTMSAIDINAVSVTGTTTTSYGINIANQSPVGGTTAYGIRVQSQTANATTTRAIEVAGTGVNNAIRLGGSPNIYSNGAENIRFDDSTAARGISFTLTAAGNQTIAATAGGLTLNNNRVGIGIAAGTNSDLLIGASANDVAGYRASLGYTDTSTTGTIRALNSELTANPGGASDASYQSASVNTFTAAGLAQNLTGSLVGGAHFVESRLNAANTLTLAIGLSSGFTNTSGITTTAHGYRSIIVVTAGTVTNGAGFFVRPPTNAGTLVNMIGLDVSDVSLAGGTTAYGIRIQSQTANATTTRAIEVVGTGVNNAIRLGASPNIYSNGAENIRFMDSTNARGIDFTLTAAGLQTIASTTANTLVLSRNVGIGTISLATVPTTLYLMTTANNNTGGLRIQDNETDTTAKFARIKVGHYTIAEEPVTMFVGSSDSTSNVLFVGGGVSDENAVTSIRFLAAATTTTLVGTIQGEITANAWIPGHFDGGTTVRTSGNIRAANIATGGAGNIAGADLTIGAGLGTGTGDEGTVIFQLPIQVGAGDIIQTTATRLTLDMAGSSTVLTMNAAQAMTVSAAAGVITLDAPDGIVLQDSSVTALSAVSDGTTATWTAAASDNITIAPTTAGNLNLDAAGADFSVVMQNRTITAGAGHEAVIISPTWAAEDFQHVGLQINATQNGTSTSNLIGANIQLIKATAASTLAEMRGIEIGAPTLMAGTVTATTGLSIQDQSLAGSSQSYAIRVASQTANATTTRAIEIAGTGVNNAIRLGGSPNIYSSAANVIRFSDATDARNIVFTLTAAGIQTIAPSAGDLALGVAGTNIAIGTTTASYDVDSWSTGTTTMRLSSTIATQGGCILLKDVTNSTEYGVIISGGVLGTTTAANC